MYRGNRDRKYVEQKRRKVQHTEEAKVQMDYWNETEMKKVNNWAIGKELGRGAYGRVVKASSNGEEVAIKMLVRSQLKRKRMGRTGSALDTVRKEIAVMKKLQHPNVVQLYEVIDDPEHDTIFLVMELITGGDLSESIARRRRPDEDTLWLWMRDLTLGLEHLHLCGVCHRDIKPENLLWDPRAKVAKLADFGVADLVADGAGGDFLDKVRPRGARLRLPARPPACLPAGGVSSRARARPRHPQPADGGHDALLCAGDVPREQGAGLLGQGGRLVGVRRDALHVALL